MRGLSPVLSAVLLILLVLALTLLFYAWYLSTQSTFTSTEEVSILVPPVILSAESNGGNVCLTVQNPTTTPIPVDGTLLLTQDGSIVATAPISTSSCGKEIPPNATCTLCAELNAPAGTYEAKLLISGTAATPSSPTASTVSVTQAAAGAGGGATYTVSFSHGLSFAPPDENRYDNILFFGEHNRVIITITGPAGAYYISSPCLQAVSCNILSGSCTVETNTTAASFLCDVNISGPSGLETLQVPVYYYFECNSAPECQQDLNDAKALQDSNSVVVLTQDIVGAYIDFPAGDYGWRVTFDGNSHEVNNAYADYAVSLSSVYNARLRNLNLDANNSAAFIFYSSASLIDINANARFYYGIYPYSSTAYLRNVRASADFYGMYVVDSNVFVDEGTFVGRFYHGVYLTSGPDILVVKDTNIYAGDLALYSYCYGCVNELNVDLLDANTYIYAYYPGGYDWDVDGGELNVTCLNCGNGYYLETNFANVYGSGTLNYNCSCVVPPP